MNVGLLSVSQQYEALVVKLQCGSFRTSEYEVLRYGSSSVTPSLSLILNQFSPPAVSTLEAAQLLSPHFLTSHLSQPMYIYPLKLLCIH